MLGSLLVALAASSAGSPEKALLPKGAPHDGGLPWWDDSGAWACDGNDVDDRARGCGRMNHVSEEPNATNTTTEEASRDPKPFDLSNYHGPKTNTTGMKPG